MRIGIDAACRDGVVAISAGNYGGKLGPHHFHLRKIMNGGGGVSQGLKARLTSPLRQRADFSEVLAEPWISVPALALAQRAVYLERDGRVNLGICSRSPVIPTERSISRAISTWQTGWVTDSQPAASWLTGMWATKLGWECPVAF